VTAPAALAWTVAVEVPIVVALAASRRWASGRLGLAALAAVGASLLTHPLAWLADRELSTAVAPVPRWIGLETAVTAVEAAAYVFALRLPLRRALAASAVSNAASFGVGLLLGSLAPA
jgi:hypothetical protein